MSTSLHRAYGRCLKVYTPWKVGEGSQRRVTQCGLTMTGWYCADLGRHVGVWQYEVHTKMNLNYEFQWHTEAAAFHTHTYLNCPGSSPFQV